MYFTEAERLLRRTFDEVKGQHSQVGHDYIHTHWRRYVHLTARMPSLGSGSNVLEIGASILSNLIRRRFGATVYTVYHELEPEWRCRYEADGIVCCACEFMIDPLPVADGMFDLILFNEVMEHFALLPDFFLKQIFSKLKSEGQLLFSVPNFAISEKRLSLLRGKNAQDPMDGRYIYYAHHREPVMEECLDLIRRCGGTILEFQWSDFDVAPSFFKVLWHCLRHLRYGKLHRIVHQLIPSTRAYIFIRAGKNPRFESEPEEGVPPLSMTDEYRRRKDRKGQRLL